MSTSAWFDMADQRKGWVLPIKEDLLHEAAALTWTGGSDLIFSLSFFSSFSIIASNHNILPVSPIWQGVKLGKKQYLWVGFFISLDAQKIRDIITITRIKCIPMLQQHDLILWHSLKQKTSGVFLYKQILFKNLKEKFFLYCT